MFRRNVLTRQRPEPLLTTVLLGSSCAISLFTFMKETAFFSLQRQFLPLKGENGNIEPSTNLKQLFEEVSKDAKEFISETSPIVPMIVSGVHCLHAGTFGTFSGAIVGLPAFFDSNPQKNLNDELEVTNPGPFDNENGVEVQPEYFMLSDNAKKYAIAREMLHVNTGQLYLHAGTPMFVAYSMNYVTETLASLLVLSRYPVFVGGVYYAAMITISLSLWKFINSWLDDKFESDVESDILQLGDDYIKGGHEYYAKYIERESSNVEHEKNKIYNKIREKFLNIRRFSSDQLHSRKSYYESLVINNVSKQ